MKKLNNKGLTAIEVLISFVIASVIVVSMFKIVNNFRDKQEIASYKMRVTTYKNTVTKQIMDSIIDCKGIKNATNDDDSSDTNKFTQSATLYCNDGTNKTLKITKDTRDNQDYYDNNSIKYGDKEYKLPRIFRLNFNLVNISTADGFLQIIVQFNNPDLGRNFDSIDIRIPLTDKYPNVY